MHPRTAFRLARVGLHLLSAIIQTATIVRWSRPPRRRWLKQRWSRKLLRILGVEPRLHGQLPPSGSLVVANHISWLDIYVVNAFLPATFICKADVRNWPVIGWLCEGNDTLFIERGSRTAARNTALQMSAALAQDKTLIVFPEGTSTDGSTILPFRPALLQSAIDTGKPIVPLALGYRTAQGERSTAPAYHGDLSLWSSLVAVAASRQPITADLAFLGLLRDPALDRQRAAAASHTAITARLLGQAGDMAPETPADPPAERRSGSPPTRSPNPGQPVFLRA